MYLEKAKLKRLEEIELYFNNQKARHKDAMELVNTYRQRKIEQTSTTVSGVEDELKPLTVNEIRDMRSLALSKGKALMASGEASKARVAYGFAESLLDDLNGAPEGLMKVLDILQEAIQPSDSQ